MPPQRTIPPAKAVKTERTHEENQERAYIAASRRSDRSLEARVESARRASEIHKRRTGRSLRVTEQDVVNEEMYEEEEDDLPMQYRRLTAHLQTGSADFNRRLAAYLTNHVAMRSALDQAITNSYAQQYPNAPQFAHNQQSMYPSPFQSQSMAPQLSPTSYRQSPYGTPGPQGFRPGPHGRSASLAGSHDTATYTQNFPISSTIEGEKTDHRRMSVPTKSTSPVATRTPQPLQSPLPASLQRSPSYSVHSESQAPQHMQAPPPQPHQTLGDFYQDFSPFSTSLPMESQMLLGPSLDPNDPLTSMFMAGSEHMIQPYSSYDPGTSLLKPRNFHPSFDGMSATLAPSALNMTPPHPPNYSETSSATTDSASAPMFNFNFDNGGAEFSKGHTLTRGNSSHGSGTATPGVDGGWDAFIDDNSWVENAA